MNVKVDGLVLRAVNYRESDKILTIITRQKGRLTVKAAGARRKSSRLASCTQPLCYSELTLFEREGRYTIDEGFVKSQFYGLCQDIEKMALASYFAQILMSEPEESAGSEAAFRLILNSLYAVEKGLGSQEIIKAAFELRYMALCGYEPDLASCALCGGPAREGYINLESGRLICRTCLDSPKYGDIYLDAGALEAAKYITKCDLKRLFAFRLPEKSLKLLGIFCEGYLLDKTEQGYRALDFYKSLFFDKSKQED